MTHSELCPLCKGRGEIYPWMQTTSTAMETCNVCNGRGYLVLGD